VERIHAEIDVPNLDVSGYYDHCNGSMAHLGLMQQEARTEEARTGSKLIVGPWNHGGLGKRRQGATDFGPAAEIDLELVMIRWFDHWLKGLQNGVENDPTVRYHVMGSGTWKSAPTWPPELPARSYYLGADGMLVDAPGDEPDADTYRYDPVDPVPTLWSRALFTEPSDRRALEHRDDILIYRTPPLDADVEVVGYPSVTLFVTSSAVDTDFFARLVDEFPGDGPAMEVSYGMVRTRHRNSFDREEFLTPGEVTELRIDLGPTACRFVARHRIRLEITSSDFPNHDRNHNTGRDDLEDTELRVAEQRVFFGGKHASYLSVPVDPS